jgi:Ring finger domain
MSARAVRRRNMTLASQSHASDTQQLLRLSSLRGRGKNTIELATLAPSQNASSGQDFGYFPVPARADDGNLISTDMRDIEDTPGGPSMEEDGRTSWARDGGTQETPLLPTPDPDPIRDARNRWIMINRRFQLVITIVALIFSLLLFAIMLCWVVLTSSYVISIDKVCDVPLKLYYWFVTLQLILDVFRADIMRLFCRWFFYSNQRIPCRVVTYNVVYLTYALLVLRMGVRSVFFNDDETICPSTAPELFQSARLFVCLSVAAWTTIIFGYLVPFIVVAAMLTWNGYTPTSDATRDGDGSGPFTVLPSVMGAPPHCIDEIPIIALDDFPVQYPMECCICVENFTGTDVIVETGCHHVFHKQCCRDWLRQARTCPVCRTDIPTALGIVEADTETGGGSLGISSGFGQAGTAFVNRNDIHHEVVSLLQILRRYERRHQSETTV